MNRDVMYRQIVLKSGATQEFALFNTGLSRYVCREVLNGDVYPLLPEDVLPANDVKLIFDVGSNVGASCVYWCDSYPNAKVVAYEPCTDAFELMDMNTSRLRVEPYNVALGGTDGFVDLYYNIEDSCCNSTKDHKSHGKEKVVMDRARTHINEPADILKIDTEGCEYEILADIEAWIGDMKVLYLEYHSEQTRHRIDEMLKPTHTLWSSSATRPHRGNLCYVRTRDVPESYANWEIP